MAHVHVSRRGSVDISSEAPTLPTTRTPSTTRTPPPPPVATLDSAEVLEREVHILARRLAEKDRDVARERENFERRLREEHQKLRDATAAFTKKLAEKDRALEQRLREEKQKVHDTTVAFTKKLEEKDEAFERRLREEKQKLRDATAAFTRQIRETENTCKAKIRELIVSNASKLANARREYQKRSPSPKVTKRSEEKTTEGRSNSLESYVRQRGLFGAEVLRTLPKRAPAAAANAHLTPLPAEVEEKMAKEEAKGDEGETKRNVTTSTGPILVRGTPTAHVHVSRRGSVDIDIDRE
eukprot:g1354.t1